MPLEIVLGTIAGIGTLTSLLFGGGLFKTAMNHSNELAVQKHIQNETAKKVAANDASIHSLKTDLALVNKDVDSFADHIKKLEILPEISSKLTGIETLIAVLREQFRDMRLDRAEHDRDKNK